MCKTQRNTIGLYSFYKQCINHTNNLTLCIHCTSIWISCARKKKINLRVYLIRHRLGLISLTEFKLPYSHDLSGERIHSGSHTYFFDHTRTWRVSPDEWSAQVRGHLQDSTNKKDHTHHAHTHSFQQGEYEMTIMAAKWYSGTLWA